ncbi:MAG: RagB/SusD family nutrient uptake outer membrane protein [Ginsengibacter sp.]
MNTKIFYITCLSAIILFLAACDKQLLYPVPESILTTANAFNTAKDLNLATLGVYSAYQARLPHDYELIGAPSDNMYAEYFATAPGIADIALLTVSSDNPKLNSFWKDTYNGIFRANSVLINIDKPTDYGATQKEQLTGEAKFMRALFYFDLVRIFGGVPAVTSAINFTDARQLPRASEEDIYNLIVTDLKDAVASLPPPTSIATGRASKAAALAFLGKVYVYRANWTEAKSSLEQLFSGYNYKLVTNYRDLFRIETEDNSEVIFKIPYVSGTNGQSLTYDLIPNGGAYGISTGGNRVCRPTWDLETAFEKEDSRLEATIEDSSKAYIAKPADSPIWYPYFTKWVVPTSIATSSGLDIPVFRLADMILLYAEALYHLGKPDEALVQINKVRERAFGNTAHDYTMADISTDETFMDKLLLERRLELAVENNRWFDLVRSGRFTSVLTTIQGEYNPSTGKAVLIPLNAKPFMKYFPIPYEQIQLAAPGILKQNDGYN